MSVSLENLFGVLYIKLFMRRIFYGKYRILDRLSNLNRLHFSRYLFGADNLDLDILKQKIDIQDNKACQIIILSF